MMLKKTLVILSCSLLAAVSNVQAKQTKPVQQKKTAIVAKQSKQEQQKKIVTTAKNTKLTLKNSKNQNSTPVVVSLRTNQPQNSQFDSHIYAVANNPQLGKVYRQWVGTRYRLGGSSHSGIDCSAFMQETFSQAYGLALPRSTAEQKSVGKKINKDELKQGDLVFFRKNNHVGIYLGNGKFMHASTSQGVTISSMDEEYWARTYTQSRRVL